MDKKSFKKLTAAVLSLGLLVTPFANGMPAKAEEATIKK